MYLELWEKPHPYAVNVRNGLVIVQTRQLCPHTPDFLSPVQLPVVYDPSATCPAWDSFVLQVFPQDAWDFAWEIIGWLMVPDTSIQKAILLLGSGGNGKSTWLTAVRAFLGKENTASVSLHKLEQDRFAVTRLVGKLANVCADLPSGHLVSSSTFKAITGGDSLSAEYKFKDAFDFTPWARLLFSANELPVSGDASEAFFDRWVVVPFEKTFRGTNQEAPRHILDAQLSNPRELSGVLNRALVGLQHVSSNHGFSEPQSVRAARDEFRTITDPLAVWLDRFTFDGADALVVKEILHSSYNDYARSDHRTPMTATAFGRALRKLRPHISEAQRTIDGKVKWVWLGIGLRFH